MKVSASVLAMVVGQHFMHLETAPMTKRSICKASSTHQICAVGNDVLADISI